MCERGSTNSVNSRQELWAAFKSGRLVAVIQTETIKEDESKSVADFITAQEGRLSAKAVFMLNHQRAVSYADGVYILGKNFSAQTILLEDIVSAMLLSPRNRP